MRKSSDRLPPLNALRAFESAARHLNFRLAADELGVSQGAVAQHVRGLEADLGLRLFLRLPRGLTLTEHGRSYAGHLRRAFELMREATSSLRDEPTRLTISVTPTFAAKWLIPRLAEFRTAYPELELAILATEALANFQSDGVDIAVRQGGPPFASALTVDLLFEQELVAVCSPALLGSERKPLQAADMERCTLLQDTHDFWPEFRERALGSTAVAPGRQVRFSQTSLAIDAAIAGQGVAVASRFLVEHDLHAGRLVQAFAATIRGRLNAFVIVPRRSRQTRPTENVRQWLLQQARSISPTIDTP